MGMLGGVEDFISLSEENIERQKGHEIRLAENTVILEDDESLQYQYRDLLVESAKYRFDVDLSQRARYAGLTALITTVDWCVLGFKRRLKFSLPKKPKAKNDTIHLLTILNEKAQLSYATEIGDLEHLIYVRNCIVHAAGLIDSYEHKELLRATLPSLNGVSLSNDNFLGPCVALGRSAISSRIESMKIWLPAMDEKCSTLGLLAT
jgi:hypothetical protein